MNCGILVGVRRYVQKRQLYQHLDVADDQTAQAQTEVPSRVQASVPPSRVGSRKVGAAG